MHSNSTALGVTDVFWKDRVSNEQVLHRIEEEKLHFTTNIV